MKQNHNDLKKNTIPLSTLIENEQYLMEEQNVDQHNTLTFTSSISSTTNPLTKSMVVNLVEFFKKSTEEEELNDIISKLNKDIDAIYSQILKLELPKPTNGKQKRVRKMFILTKLNNIRKFLNNNETPLNIYLFLNKTFREIAKIIVEDGLSNYQNINASISKLFTEHLSLLKEFLDKSSLDTKQPTSKL